MGGKRNPSDQGREHVRLPAPASGSPVLVKTGHDLDSAAGRAAVYNLISAPALPAADVLGQPLDVAGYLCHPAEREDEETGEVVAWTRTVLILRNGTVVSLAAGGARRQLEMIEAVFGPAPWAGGVQIVINEAKSRRGRTYHYFTVAV